MAALLQSTPSPLSASLWMAWVGLGLTGFSALIVVTADGLDRDEVGGTILFVGAAIGFATTSLIQGRGGKGLSIAAIVVGVVTALCALGQL